MVSEPQVIWYHLFLLFGCMLCVFHFKIEMVFENSFHRQVGDSDSFYRFVPIIYKFKMN